MTVRVIDVNVGIADENDAIANEIREMNREKGTFMINIMASPGAGKTTTLLRTIDMLKNGAPAGGQNGAPLQIGVLEADIEATVDADKMQAAGVESIQVHTGGECAMDASMVRQALEEFRQVLED